MTRRWPGLARNLLGGLLALLLLAGGWDWAQTSHRATAYHQGVAAVAARHWEAAVGAFAAAQSYADAPARAGQAAAQVAKLRANYALLATATAQGDWAAAYHAAQAVASIAPDYRDVAAQLDRTYRNWIAAGTAGVVYLQTGKAAGLYLRQLPPARPCVCRIAPRIAVCWPLISPALSMTARRVWYWRRARALPHRSLRPCLRSSRAPTKSG